MSDTPRTDAVAYDDGKHEHVRADFARQLERELAELQRKYDNLKHESDMRGSY